MSKWIVLVDQLTVLKAVPCVFPESLSPEAVKEFEAHNQFVLDSLLCILMRTQNDEAKKKQLRQFLAVHDSLLFPESGTLSISSIDCTFNPNFPANKALSLIAEAIKRPDESICQVLRPSVTHIIGAAVETDIKMASEDADEKFLPFQYLRTTSGNLLSIIDLFSYALDDPSKIFSHCLLTAEDFNNLRQCAGAASANLFDALKKLEDVKQGKKPSVGNALMELKTALLDSSKVNLGTELQADITGCIAPITDFYRVWRALSIENRNQIAQYKINNGTDTLESFLIFLFLSASRPEKPLVLSEQEKQNTAWKRIFYCLRQVGQNLETLIAHHPDLMSMPLPGKEAEFENVVLPDREILERLLGELNNALPRRMPLLGDDAVTLSRLPIFKLISAEFSDEIENPIVVALLFPRFNQWLLSSKNIAIIIALLPQQHWRSFLNEYYTVRSNACYVITLLADCFQLLPMAHWNTFFTVLSQAAPAVRLKIDHIVCDRLLSEISASKWDAFIQAIGNARKTIFKDVSSFVITLRNRPIETWSRFIKLFQPELEALCYRQAGVMLTIFEAVDPGDRFALCQALAPVLKTHADKCSLMHQFMLLVSPHNRLSFLKLMLKSCDELNLTIINFSNILNLVPFDSWKAVFELLGEKRLALFIKTDVDIALLLSQFSEKEGHAFLLSAMQAVVSVSIKTVDSAYNLLRQYPDHDSVLGLILSRSIVPVINKLLEFFSTADELRDPISVRTKDVFLFLTNKIVAVLLRCENIKSYFGLRSIETLSGNSRRLLEGCLLSENRFLNKDILQEADLKNKLSLLINFIKKANPADPIEADFSNKIIAIFGSLSFFESLFHYYVCFRCEAPLLSRLRSPSRYVMWADVLSGMPARQLALPPSPAVPPNFTATALALRVATPAPARPALRTTDPLAPGVRPTTARR